MKRVALVLLLMTVIISCDSDKPTDPFVPIDPVNLIGTWNGNYALTYNAGTDSARTYEVEVQIIFADTSFTFSGEPISSCATYGGGRYYVTDGILEFEDNTLRPTICDWANILHGQFSYAYEINSDSPPDMHMSQSMGRLHWQIDLAKMPEIEHH